MMKQSDQIWKKERWIENLANLHQYGFLILIIYSKNKNWFRLVLQERDYCLEMLELIAIRYEKIVVFITDITFIDELDIQ